MDRLRTYLTPQQMATLADELREETHAEIADVLGVDRSSVSHALSAPSTRKIKVLTRILELYLDAASPDPRFPVVRPVEDVLEDCPYDDDDLSAAWWEGARAGLAAANATVPQEPDCSPGDA